VGAPRNKERALNIPRRIRPHPTPPRTSRSRLYQTPAYTVRFPRHVTTACLRRKHFSRACVLSSLRTATAVVGRAAPRTARGEDHRCGEGYCEERCAHASGVYAQMIGARRRSVNAPQLSPRNQQAARGRRRGQRRGRDHSPSRTASSRCPRRSARSAWLNWRSGSYVVRISSATACRDSARAGGQSSVAKRTRSARCPCASIG